MLAAAIFFWIAGSCLAQNLNLGLLKGTLGVQAGFEYTDNLGNSQSNQVTDISWLFGPTFSGGLRLPINIVGTGGEELVINTGLAYSEEYSLNGNEHTRSFSSPVVADVYFPLSFGLWKVVISDSFTFKNDALEEAIALNEPSTSQYNNRLNIGLTRNYGKALLTLGAERADRISPSDPYLDETLYQFSITPALLIREHYSLFWGTTYAISELVDPTRQDSVGIGTSIGVSGAITPQLNGTLAIGYAHTHLKATRIGPGVGIFGGIFDPEIVPADNIDGLTSSVALSYAHPVNPNTSYSLSVYNSPGVTAVLRSSSVTEVYGLALGVSHRLTPKVTLSPVFSWTHAEAAGRNSSGEVTDLYSVRLSMQRTISNRIRATLDYTFASKVSNQPGGTFDVNRLTVKMNYTF